MAPGRDRNISIVTPGFIDCLYNAPWTNNRISSSHRHGDKLGSWLWCGLDNAIALGYGAGSLSLYVGG
jgi:hypothetical protein